MKNKNKKGFTLIELLAVIVILGIILVIAIPSISAAILNSRKNAYVATANEFVDGLRIKALTNPSLLPTSGTSCIPITDIKLEKGSNTKSPFGKKYTSDSKVCVKYEESKKDYTYSVCLVDEGGNGLSSNDVLNLAKKDVKLGNANYDELEGIVVGNPEEWVVSTTMNSTGGYTLEKFIGDMEGSDSIKVTKDYFDESNISPFYKDYIEQEFLSEIPNKNAYTVNIPNKVGDKNITEIKEGLFSGYDVINEELIEPNMRIKSANIPEGIKKIGKATEDSDIVAGVFLYNWHLSEVNFPSTLKEIGINDFYSSSITDIVIPKSVETIGIQAFADVFPFNSLTFEGANDRTSQLETIGVGAFASDLNLPEIIPEINLIIPASVKTISTYAFAGIPLASLTFVGTSTDGSGNDSSLLVNIGRKAFDFNNQNHTIYLPSSLTNVGSLAFYNDSSATFYINRLSIPETFDITWLGSNGKKYILNGTGGYWCIHCP